MKLIKTAFIAIVLCVASTVHAYDIIGNISGLKEKDEITLYVQTGSVYQEIAKAGIKDNRVHFLLDAANAAGVYQLRHGNFKVDLLFNHQNIVFDTTYLTPAKNIRFATNKQNQDFYRLRNAIENHAARQVFLTRLLNVYSVNSSFYQAIQTELDALSSNSYAVIKDSIMHDKNLSSSLLRKKINYEDKLSEGLKTLIVQTKKEKERACKLKRVNAYIL